MGSMRLFSGFSRIEKTVFGTALILACLSLFLFIHEDLFARLLNGEREISLDRKIGQLEDLSRDVRLKNDRTFQWQKARTLQGVHTGDSIFCGEASSAKVSLGEDKSVEVKENSLIRFSEMQGQRVGDLQLGDFKLKVDGAIRIAINGVPTILEGKNSEAQIRIDGQGRSKIKLVKGAISVSAVKTKAKSRAKPEMIRLVQNQETTFTEVYAKSLKLSAQAQAPAPVVARPEEKASEEMDLPLPLAEEPPPAIVAQPIPFAMESRVRYLLRLYDIYQLEGTALKLKSAVPGPLSKIKAGVDLAWETNFPQTVDVEYARDADFTRELQQLTTEQSVWRVNENFVGANYWRVRGAGGSWSKVQSFDVTLDLLPRSPVLSASATEIPLIDGFNRARLAWQAPVASIAPIDLLSSTWMGYVLEESSNPAFADANTRRSWHGGNGVDLEFHDASTRFFRVRAVNDKNELTPFGPTIALRGINPPLLTAPFALKHPRDFARDKKWPVQIAWKPVTGAVSYTFVLRSGKDDAKIPVEGTRFLSADLATSPYTFRVAAVDQWGREGEFSDERDFKVSPNAVVKVAAPALAKLESARDPKRSPGSEDEPRPGAETEPQSPSPSRPTLVAPLEMQIPRFLNTSYRDSHFQIEGLNMILVSNLSNGSSAQVPLVGGLAARIIHWFSAKNGTEVSLKSKVVGYDEAGRNISPLAFEARYQHRWLLPWRWFSFLRELQVSGIAGVESYRNPNSQNFASTYDVAKTGFGLEFPLGQKWDTGGESLLGLAADASKKFELSGHIHYYYDTRVSIGLGYRLHVFDAGGTKSSPSRTLPYREAYGEGYSVLRLSY